MKSIAVTGIAGYLGKRLLKLLDGDPEITSIVGLDVRPLDATSEKLAFFQKDINDPLEEIFKNNGVEGVVHLAFAVNPLRDARAMTRINVDGTENLLRACDATGVKKIVVASSATAYGAHPDNPDFLREDHPLRGNDDYQYAREKVVVERLCAQYAGSHPEAAVCVVRPSTIMGPNVGNYISRFVSRRLVFTVSGSNPRMQFVHEDDAARAFYAVLKKGKSGAYNIAGDGPLTIDEVNALVGKRPIRLPAWLVYPVANTMWRLRLSEAPGPMVHFVRYPWVVDTSKITNELEFEFEKTTEEAFLTFAKNKLSKTKK